MRTTHLFFLAAGFVLLWNSGFIGAEYGLPYAGPFTLLFWRYLALSVILFAWLALRKRLWWPGTQVVMPQMLIGALSHGVWLGCVLVALDLGVAAGIVALIVALQPLATGALSGTVAGEPTPPVKWVGLILGFLGVAITLSYRIDYQSTASVVGHLIPLGSVIAITFASLLQRKMELYRKTPDIPLDMRLFWQSLATTAILVIPAWAAESFAASWEPPFIYTMTWLVIAVSLGAYALMWMLLKHMDATRVASLFYLGPPVTMWMAWIAFGDTVQHTDLAGLAVVLAGVLLAQKKGVTSS